MNQNPWIPSSETLQPCFFSDNCTKCTAVILCDLKLPVRKDTKKLLATEDTNECSCCTNGRNMALRVSEPSLYGAITKPKTLE